MSLNRARFMVEVEVLEDRTTPTAINPGAAALVIPSAPPQAAASGQTSQTGTTTGPAVVVPPTQTLGQANPGTFNPAVITTIPQSNVQNQSGVPVPAANQLAQFSPNQIANAFALTPTGAGVLPLNNSIPNAAATLSAGAGLNSLSAFLPTYYIGYTQVGPFYTGGDSPTTPPVITESPSYFPANMEPAPNADESLYDGDMAAVPSSVDPMLAAVAALSLVG